MAIPTSPSVVVRENDTSFYAPNIDSSVVGLVGFATKGPINKATLITSQDQLLRLFGKPDKDMPSQGLLGALEILEATNQVYFVRGASSTAEEAAAEASVGASPAVYVSGYVPSTNTSSIYYSVKSNDGNVTVTGSVDLVQSDDYTTEEAIMLNAFNPELVNGQHVFAYRNPANSQIYLASKYAGSGAELHVSSSDDFEFRALEIDGDPSSTGSNNVTSHGFTSSSVTLDIESIYPGTGYSFSLLRDGTNVGVSVEVNNISTRDQIVINNDGAAAEAFNATELSPGAANSVEFIFNEDPLANQSEYVTMSLASGGGDYVAPDKFGDKATAAGFVGEGVSDPDGTPRFLKLIEGTYTLSGGDNGEDPAGVGLIGSKSSKTGLYLLDDDGLNISIAAIPGITDQSVQNALVTIAETSKNFLALVSPPLGLTEVQDAVDWINGASQTERTAAVNSTYAAVYWPWVQVFNTFDGADMWYDPAIFAARQCVFTDAVSEPWFAPAGFRRGRLTKPTAVELPLNQGDRDVLYSNSINPIYSDRSAGITIFGQRTAQREPTALDRVNVRRLMIFIRKVLLDLGRPFQFEPNDQFTWELVEDAINPFLDDLKSRRAIIEGVVKCDSTVNTPGRVDRNELWCSIAIKPTKAAETVVFEVNLTSQAANING